MNREALYRLTPHLSFLRFFKKELGDPRWKEIDRERAWVESDDYPIFARGVPMTFPWMVGMPTTPDSFPSWKKWQLYDELHQICHAAGFVTLFVSAIEDRLKLSHIVVPKETDAVVLDAHILNFVQDFNG